jgi:diguanylate cyclase (GGDEF)-like protein
MTSRLFQGLGLKRSPEPEPPAAAPRPAVPSSVQSAHPRGAASTDGTAAPEDLERVQQAVELAFAALALAQDLTRGVEQFVLSTPDLDTPGFLNRLRHNAADLTVNADPAEIAAQRQWVNQSLPTFGQLQRRYLAEREDELWRLISLYQAHLAAEGKELDQFHQSLRSTHERMGDLLRLDDLRQIRESLQTEIQRANTLVEEKTKVDHERSVALSQRVQQLETALASARHEAERDALTGVYHRRGLEKELESALASPGSCAMAMIDIDNFKNINDTLGHLAGDQILKIAVQLLGKSARPGEVVGRFGGDELCVVAPATPARRLAERMEGLAAPRNIQFELEDRLRVVRLSFSIGVAASLPGDDIEALIQRADAALYDAKRDGKGQAKLAPTAMAGGVPVG